MTCSPNDIAINPPSGPSGPAIPGFGVPGALNLPNINPFPSGFPEDLMDILEKLQLLVPPGALKPALNPNFGKDVYDGVMKLMDQFFPFLMLYKFFMPVLNMIVCIIEVLCSIMNPFKMRKAITRLFRKCIPEFLNMFPMFAVIVMLISLFQLLLALIEYLLEQTAKVVKAITRNINALNKAFSEGNSNSVLAIAKKLGSLLCMFQNLFVLLSLFSTIFNVIRDILKSSFSIPPCEDSDPDGCCSTDVCPAIVRQPYTRTTGTFQYFGQVSYETTILLPPALGGAVSYDVRSESWQIYDESQAIAQKFINIVDGYDVTVFFPTDAVYSAKTAVKQAPYTIDLRLYYNPASWGRIGVSKWIRFKDCIVTNVPTDYYNNYNNNPIVATSGVLRLAGGSGYEDDGVTKLYGYASDGTTPSAYQATLENFIHVEQDLSTTPKLKPTDGYAFYNMEYTFKPNIDVLINKQIITLGCAPELSLNKSIINSMFAGDAALQLQEILNTPIPDTDACMECLSAAVSGLRNDLTLDGAANFQATVDICLNTLKKTTLSSLSDLIKNAVDPCNSTFILVPKIQFTSEKIKVSVELKDRNKLSLSTSLNSEVATALASQLKAYPSLGTAENFVYDGYQYFTTNIMSTEAGSGILSVSFDGNIFCQNNIPADITIPPTRDLISLPYTFVYTSTGSNSHRAVGDQSDGQAPRRDEGDLADAGRS